MSVSRAEKYKNESVARALEAIRREVGDEALEAGDGATQQVRRVLTDLYYAGAGWGEQDAAAEAAREIRDLEYERDMERAYW